MTTFELQERLKDAAVYALFFAGITLAAAGLFLLLNRANVRFEARCQQQGGQVLRAPGEVSRCLLPAAR
jgi:hypothetical protein